MDKQREEDAGRLRSLEGIARRAHRDDEKLRREKRKKRRVELDR